MIKVKKSKIAWLLFACFLLIVTIVFAWFFGDNIYEAGFYELDGNYKTSSPDDLQVKIMVPDNNGNYIDIGNGEEGSHSIYHLLDNMLPNDTVSFKICVSNKSKIIQNGSLYFSGITVTPSDDYLAYIDDNMDYFKEKYKVTSIEEIKKSLTEELLSYMYFGYRRYGGAYSDGRASAPAYCYICLSESKYNKIDNTYSMKLFDNIQFPVTTEVDPITKEERFGELFCYLYFDRNAGSDLMDLLMNIEYVEIIV